MPTKTKVTKESVPKEANAASTAPVPKKDTADKAEKTVESPKAAKTASNAKPNSATESSEPGQELNEKADTAGKAAEPAIKPVASDGQRWQEIRLILEKLKEDTVREIRKSIKTGTEAVAAIEPGGDIYDQASSERDRELGLLLGDREREKIHNIDEALLRIDEGEYGICEECDEDIPLGRLKAMPFTRHCVKCKSDLEKLQAQTKRVEEERAYREIPLGAEEDES